jgi:hypothetical protein
MWTLNRQGRCLALALTSFVLAGAPQPAQAQYIQQGPKLIGTNGSTDALQGYSVALSADGNTALVGGPYDNGQAGAVWFYTRSGGVWSQQGSKLTVTDNISNARFGWAVALSADGNTALIGGPADNTMFGGAAWVFTRSGGVWSEQAKLVATDLARSFGVTVLQGASVALSADGNTAVVGAPQDASLTGGGGITGVAVVFTRSAGAWGEQQRIAGSVNGMVPAAAQGTSVALSADGNTAAVGAPGYNNGDPSDGAVFIVTRSNGVWSQQGGALIGTGGTSGGSHQGQSVALSTDGNTLLEGGPADGGGGAQAGAAWVFARSGGVWSQQSGKLFLPASSATLQGQSVALSGNGNVGMVGAPGLGPGQVIVYARSGGTWSQRGGTLQGNGGDVNTAQGTSVALSADGNTVLEGGDGYNFGAGAAWVFRRSVTHDFNGDGKSDIVWQDTSGNTAVWLMNSNAILSAGSFALPGWSLVGQRDFNADGDSDMLWRDGSGDTFLYLMNGTSVTSALYVGTISGWTVAAVGSFAGVGTSGLVWKDAANDFVLWLMNPSQPNTVASSVYLGTLPGWSIAGTGDFNGDGFTDLLWRDAAGDTYIWFMKSTTVLSTGFIGKIPAPWSVVGTGDFNGDGIADIVWNDGAGHTSVWLMSSTSITSTGNFTLMGWSLAQVGDYNGDGNSDLLWRDAAGDTYIWFMNGTAVSSVGYVATVGSPWAVQSVNAE